MLCYPILWYGMESMVCYEISMLCYEISMLCYAMAIVYVVKKKHSTTVYTGHNFDSIKSILQVSDHYYWGVLLLQAKYA